MVFILDHSAILRHAGSQEFNMAVQYDDAFKVGHLVLTVANENKYYIEVTLKL